MSEPKTFVDPSTLTPRTSSAYPDVFRARVLPREKRGLGDALGLTKIGVNLTTLMPGKESALRHWHTHEDELVYVLEGELVMVTDAGEERIGPGMCAGFKAGVPNGHQFVNRGETPVRYLEISNRDGDDLVAYPDADLDYNKDADGKGRFTHKDGTPW